MVNAIFDVAGVSIEGERTDSGGIAESGNVMHRRFCPTTG